MHELRISKEEREQKTVELYAFITSEHCKQLLDQVETQAGKMLELESKEQEAHRRLWDARSKLIHSVQKARSDLVFEIDRIIGTAGNGPRRRGGVRCHPGKRFGADPDPGKSAALGPGYFVRRSSGMTPTSTQRRSAGAGGTSLLPHLLLFLRAIVARPLDPHLAQLRLLPPIILARETGHLTLQLDVAAPAALIETAVG